MQDKIMRIKTSIVINYLLFGFTWLCVGVLSFFDDYLVCKILLIIFLLVSIIGMFVTFFAKKEKYDEMASTHMTKAQSYGFMYLLLFVLVLTIIFKVLDMANINVNLNFLDLYPFFLAVGEISVGLKFLQLEKDGD
ncbi:hypothetical protein RBG61_13150 [Paludicola sp. MB14-C6]|uniref:hypothetical protein n=1 Tax=Paludihabitans sp. MB14-C6 TaxID=3070656 RepID=UPI0027DD425D|nr:hypothetical protein [Paludicola sp. MB14-C6]WMJ22921.1 hypothetical protein RBG61_13150 [Paludicola sp. MB14-C6]